MSVACPLLPGIQNTVKMRLTKYTLEMIHSEMKAAFYLCGLPLKNPGRKRKSIKHVCLPIEGWLLAGISELEFLEGSHYPNW